MRTPGKGLGIDCTTLYCKERVCQEALQALFKEQDIQDAKVCHLYARLRFLPAIKHVLRLLPAIRSQ
jgi:hypothetical protein